MHHFLYCLALCLLFYFAETTLLITIPTKNFNKHLQYGSRKINEIIGLKELTLK